MCFLCAFEILTQICRMVISQQVILTTFIVLLLVAWTTFTKRAAHEFFRMFYLPWKLQLIGLDRQDDEKFWWVVNSQSVFTECVFSMWCLKNSMISGLISWQTTSWCFFLFCYCFHLYLWIHHPACGSFNWICPFRSCYIFLCGGDVISEMQMYQWHIVFRQKEQVNCTRSNVSTRAWNWSLVCKCSITSAHSYRMGFKQTEDLETRIS